MSSQYYENFQQIGGYYTPVKGTNLTDPSNIFLLQNTVTNNLVDFENTYGRYVRCQYPATQSNVNPPCHVDTSDSFDHLYVVYDKLLGSIIDLSNALTTNQNQNQNHLTPEQYNQNIPLIQQNYINVLNLRTSLDAQLQKLNAERANASGTSGRLLESAAFANSLWVVLASCLIYYVFIEL